MRLTTLMIKGVVVFAVVFALGFMPSTALATEDLVIDADGVATCGDGVPAAVDCPCGSVLTAFPAGFNDSGLDMFDRDGNAAWTFGVDALHAEGLTFCPTAIRDGLHQLGRDCCVLGPMIDGEFVSCDLEVGAFCTPPLPSPITFCDSNGNGAWDSGEDIILDANGNDIYDCKAVVPAVSEWGMGVITLLLLTGITIKFARRQARAVTG